jgi:hypothetical protein
VGNKIIQIMPAPAGLKGVIFDDCGNRRLVPLLAVGLTEHGGIRFLYIENGNSIGYAKEVIYDVIY